MESYLYEKHKDYKLLIYLIYVMLLTFITLFVSRHGTGLLLSGGLLMMAVTYDSMTENRNIGLMMIAIILAGIFAFCTDTLFGFSVLSGFYSMKRSSRMALMLMGFACWSIRVRGNGPADFLLGILILSGIALFFFLAEYLVDLAGRFRMDARQRITNATVNEMHIVRMNQEIRRNSYLLEKNARMKEREDISRNIHNSVGHTITAAIMTLDAADLLYEKQPDLAKEKVSKANERMRGSLEAIRRAVRVLDEEEKVIPASDLKESMDSIIENFVMDTRIHVSKNDEDLPGEVMLPHEYVEFVTGALQEFLTNGVKHGNATRYVIYLSGDSGHIRLVVKDNGSSSFGVENADLLLEKGFGLKKVITFVERCGGNVDVNNEEGFEVSFTLPFD